MNGGEAEGLVQHRHHEHELGRNLLAIGMIWKTRTLSNVSPLSSTEVCTKVDRISPVVNMELHVIVPGILKNESLNVVDVCGELGEGQQALRGDALVDLGHMLQMAQAHVTQCTMKSSLLSINFSFPIILVQRLGLKRLKINLTQWYRSWSFLPAAPTTPKLKVLQEGEPGGWLGQRQQHRQPGHLLCRGAVSLDEPVKLWMLTW